MLKKLREWFYEDVEKARAGRHAPQLPRFVPSLVLLLVLTVLGLWLIFVSFARLTVGSSISYWWPDPNSVPNDQLFSVVRSTVTAAAVFAGMFAIVYAYRKQRGEEADGRRADEEGLSQRYQDAATQLGSDRPAIRLAGVYSLGRLADDWPEQRQVCIDVLCAYMRMPWDLDDRSEDQVRRTVAAVFRRHLHRDAITSWSDQDFDFNWAVLANFKLDGAVFQTQPLFRFAEFHGLCSLNEAVFQAGADFDGISVFGEFDLRDVIVAGGHLALSSAHIKGQSSFIAPAFIAAGSQVKASMLDVEKGNLFLAFAEQAGRRGQVLASHITVRADAGVWVDRARDFSDGRPFVDLPRVNARSWIIRGDVHVDNRFIDMGFMEWDPREVGEGARLTISHYTATRVFPDAVDLRWPGTDGTTSVDEVPEKEPVQDGETPTP